MSAVLGTLQIQSRWRQPLLALGAVVLALLVLFRETFGAMVEIWARSETFTHAFLVPPIALWLTWRLRDRLAALAPAPQPWMLGAIVVASATWLVGDLAAVNALTQFAATLLLVLAVPAVLGLQVARVLVFPLAFLFFMVPIGEFLLPVLMEHTANFAVAALRLSGVPVYREGLQFVIPSGHWSVIEACSGVRYLIASFMVGTLFAYLNYRSTPRRLAFVAVSIVVPIVANWLRAYMIVMLGHLSDNRIATGVDHLVYGWVFFGVVIMLMFFIGARWSEQPATEGAQPNAAAAAPAAAGGTWVVAALAVMATAWPHAAAEHLEHQIQQQPPRVVLPATLPGGWALEAAPARGYHPAFIGAPAKADGVYRSANAAVGVDIAYYRAQGPGRKLVSAENLLVRADSHDWIQTARRDGVVEAGGRRIGYHAADVLGGGMAGGSADERKLEARQLWWVDGAWASSAQEAALRGVLGKLAGRGDDAAGVVLHVAGLDPASTRALLDDFMRQHLGGIEAALAAARRGAEP